jgi:hypothetical protein
MRIGRCLTVLAMLGMLGVGAASAQTTGVAPELVVRNWYRLVLELVRHTPTMSPPVASRAMAYIGVSAYETVAAGADDMTSLAGQLNGLTDVPTRETGAVYDEAVALQAALSASVASFFANTGPTGQRAMTAVTDKFGAKVSEGVPADVVARSAAYGRAMAAHIVHWSQGDGGSVVENMGFPYDFRPKEGPQYWVPTSLVRQQQAPLLPQWGNNRPFVMPTGNACPLPPPPEYSEDPGSQFYAEAKEVFDVAANLTDEQKTIARFWSDDPMLSPTPPGHWMSIALQILERDGADVKTHLDVMTRLGIGMSDAFIGCWYSKFEYDLVRPVTYIRRVIDPNWETALITPPFPEYPSGHSTQSGAAATVLTALYGDAYAFSDATHEDDGLAVRDYTSFWDAAEEAGLSRLYGGIHFRAAIERGLDQGRCIGEHTNALKTLVK